jgi:hypothetical protein
MSENISLKELEKSVFKVSVQDGFIDIIVGLFLLGFAVAPLLSESLGDFWSTAVVWLIIGLIYLGLQAVRKHLIQPRVGKIEFGSYRKKRLTRLNLVMLVFNLVALIVGIVVFFRFSTLPGWAITFSFSIIMLVGFSLVAYMLEFPRLFIYGILAAFAIQIGEFLYQNFQFSHHGFPAVFGTMSAALILIGLAIMVRILVKYPLPGEDQIE